LIGPTPAELLKNDYQSIFNWPQTRENVRGPTQLN
jgi:hypothetical protein